MKTVRPSDQHVEVQGVDNGDIVTVYLGSGKRIVIEPMSSDTINLTIDFGSDAWERLRPVAVYDDQEGEQIAMLRAPEVGRSLA